MTEYPKIQTVFKRDPANMKRLLIGEYSLPEFEYIANNIWVFTEKIDGTNIRVMWDGQRITFGGKTDRASIQAELVAALESHFLPQRDRFAAEFPDGGVCFYGEGYGAKIQKGGELYRPDQGFILFDIRVGPWWLRRDDVTNIADKFGMCCVPVIGTGALNDMIRMVRNGIWSAAAQQTRPAEGVVARPAVDLLCRNGQRVITKLKTRDFAGGKA